MTSTPGPAGNASRTRGEIAAGAAWMVAFKLTERSLGFVSTLVLVRVLLPADFGIIAMAMSLIGVLELLKTLSLDLALIQRREVDRVHLDTAWTLNLLIGLVVAVIMLLLAQPAAAYFSEPRLAGVIYGLTAGWFIQSFENIGPVAFRRDLDFRTEYRFLVAKKLAAVVITVPLAFWLRTYWALVIGMVASKALSVAISYLMHTYRPRLSLAATADLLGFSSWLVLNNAIYFFNDRVTDFVIGRMAGAPALGLYNISYEIANMPTTEIMAPINRVMMPGYAKMQRDDGDFRRTYLDTVGVMTLFSFPAGVGIAAVAAPLVALLLGPRWLAATPIIQVLGIYGSVVSMGSNTASAMITLGRQRTMTLLASTRLALLVPAVIWATGSHGVLGTALAVLAVTLVMSPVNFLVQVPMLGIRLRDFISHIWRPIVASIVMYFAVSASLQALRSLHVTSSLAGLAVGLGAGLAAYVATVALAWHWRGRPEGAEALLLRHARSWLAQRQ